jgi:hypothetical protein
VRRGCAHQLAHILDGGLPPWLLVLAHGAESY